jgi:dipeptidyl aminopeptidase/acylaminoacyl peptidase
MDRVSDPQVSPDGKVAAYVVRSYNIETNGSTSALWLVDLKKDSNPRQLTHPPAGKRDSSPRWMPDGKTLAFLSNRSGSWQIWKISAQGGEAAQWSDLPISVGGLLVSPTGTHFAFTTSVFPDCDGDMLACTAKRQEQAEKNIVKARIYDKLLIRHWDTWEDGTRSHLFVIPTDSKGASKDTRDLTPGDSNVPPSLEGGTGYDFSPDGKEMAYARNIDTKKFADEALSTNSDVWVVPITGGDPKSLSDDKGWEGTPQYSPDGQWIAYAMMHREGFEADLRHLMLYNRETQKHKSLTYDFPYNVGDYGWSHDSSHIYFTAMVNGNRGISRVRIEDGSVNPVIDWQHTAHANVGGNPSQVIFTTERSDSPAELYLAGEANWTRLTNHNGPKLDGIAMNRAEPIYVEGAEGKKVHAWLIKPPGFDPSKKYPVVVLIHGGPQGTWSNSFHFRWNMQLFAAPGYVVVAPNPRGSPGWGQEFVDDITRDWGGKVYTDIMNVTDYVAALPYTDETRMCAGGGSYGGYMANWILGHTDRFRCLFSHDGVYNLESMYGSTEELWFPEWEMGGTPWENPELYAKWSPHNYAENFKTPTLVIHGEFDYRLPFEQSLALFTTLQRRGVKSKLLYFPDENHWVLKPANSQLWYHTVHGWLAEHLK